MERLIIKDLITWKNSPDRKPLILLGARQVGKTYILRHFGMQEYENVAYINCDNNELVRNLFIADYDIKRVILAIGAITGQKIVPGKTLIIFDEIQELKRGLTALKYFQEEAPQYHVAVAGSLLGITMRHGESAPVGKVDILRMYPMTFLEFLHAIGKSQLVDILLKNDWPTISMLRGEYAKLLRQYYFVGGMPEAVKSFIKTGDTVTVRRIQQNILTVYESDMAKHTTSNEVTRIRQVWQSIPSQLAKENKKFIYGAIKKGARAKDFELAIQWLQDAGLVYRIHRASEPKIPLSFYTDLSAFKLYLLDTGLHGALSNTPAVQMLVADNAMEEAKGAFTENYVFTQLSTLHNVTLCYFSAEDSQLEIDALVQYGERVYPVEIKAEENLRSKSLRTYIGRYPYLQAIRFSMSDYRKQDWLTNVPLYACLAYLSTVPSQQVV